MNFRSRNCLSLPPLLCLQTLVWLAMAGCSASDVETSTSNLGQVVTETEMLRSLERPGSITFTKHLTATWSTPLSGLVNLDHPKAQAAGLEDRDEAVEIYVYSLEHPVYGNYIVDSGMAESFRNPKTNDDISALVKLAMNTDAIVTRKTTREVSEQLQGIDGVFLTHLHLDHIMGLLDIESTVPVYVGPGDAEFQSFLHLVTRGTTNRLLATVSELQEWSFGSGKFLDVFSDGSLYAIHAPGHTPGTTVYLANTTNGLEMMIGDVTHTRWGWENGVEPGTYSHEISASAVSLAYIKQIARRLPGLRVHPGHQSL